MPHLTDLAGNPITWEELKRRNAEWHDTHDAHGDPLPDRCTSCMDGWHNGCTALMGKSGTKNCGCWEVGHTIRIELVAPKGEA